MFFSLLTSASGHNTGIYFSENKGQWENNILYRTRLDGGMLYLEKGAFTYSFYDQELLHALHTASKEKLNKYKSLEIRSHAFRVTFSGASAQHASMGFKAASDYENYFIGKDRSRWKSGVKRYQQVVYKDLYKGINLEIFGLENSIKYNFVLAPNSDPASIVLNYEGVEDLFLEKGKLHIKTSLNQLIEQEPFAYQWIDGRKVTIPCKFRLSGRSLSFDLGHYNKNYELVIDPILIFGSYSGSTADNFGMTATYDSKGHLYAGGTAFATGYPVTLGAFDPTYNGIVQQGRTDVVITKYDSAGTSLIYSTYIGGAVGSEIVTSLIVNAQNELFLYGATGSSDFPVTPTAYDTSFGGGLYLSFVYNGTKFSNGTDIFVAKLDAQGSSLLGCTYIGGSGNDGVNHNNVAVQIQLQPPLYEYPADSLQFNYGDQYRGEINLDKAGNCYIASSSRSSDFPIVNGFDNSLGGKQDAVVFKFNSNLTSLAWSTYLGGADNDAGYAIAVDDSMVAYVTGGTRSSDFPTTPFAIGPFYGGGKADGFVTKINKTGTAILNSTYIGTGAYDQSYFVQLDKKKKVYIVGQTAGAFPVSGGVYSNPNSGQFVAKLDNNLTSYIYSTVFGNGNGVPTISPAAFLVDDCENVYVSGWGGNIITGVPTNNMPLTVNAFQNTTDGFNFYLIVFSKDILSLLYATYFGGGVSREHVDGGTSRFDKKGIVYQSVCAGCGSNDDFPTTPGAWSQTNNSNNCNNGVFKFDFQVKLASSEFTTTYQSQCAPVTVQYTNSNPNTQSYFWNFGNNDTTSTDPNPSRTYTTPGTYLAILIVKDTSSCNKVDTSFQYITVYDPIVADADYVLQNCTNNVSFFDSSVVANDTAAAWYWDFGDGQSSTLKNPVHTYSADGTYTVTLVATTNNGCTDTTQVQVIFVGVPASVSADTTVCLGNAAHLHASGGFAYSWSPATGLSSTSVADPYANPTDTTTYTVVVSTINNNGDTCYVTLTTTVNIVPSTVGSALVTSDRDTIFKGESTQLHTDPANAVSYSWFPVEGLSDPAIANPSASPIKTTTYTVTITGAGGCSVTREITVVVLPNICDIPDIFVPNSFTPNGDGKNDVFRVRGNNVETCYLAVYDRWGEKVFESANKNVGWDGTYKGKPVNPDVFAYYIKVVCFNGKEYFQKGNVTVIR